IGGASAEESALLAGRLLVAAGAGDAPELAGAEDAAAVGALRFELPGVVVVGKVQVRLVMPESTDDAVGSPVTAGPEDAHRQAQQQRGDRRGFAQDGEEVFHGCRIPRRLSCAASPENRRSAF